MIAELRGRIQQALVKDTLRNEKDDSSLSGAKSFATRLSLPWVETIDEYTDSDAMDLLDRTCIKS